MFVDLNNIFFFGRFKLINIVATTIDKKGAVFKL